MRRPPFSLALAAIIGLVLAACAAPSGGGPDGSDGGQPSDAPQSEAPGASQDGGGGGGGGLDGSGSVDFEMSGGHSVSDELPFAGGYGYWQEAGVTFLVFTEDTDADEANGVIITLGPDGSSEGNVFQYVTEDLVIPVADCEWNLTQNDASGAAGSFTCNDAAGFSSTGGAVMGINIRGDFQASP